MSLPGDAHLDPEPAGRKPRLDTNPVFAASATKWILLALWGPFCRMVRAEVRLFRLFCGEKELELLTTLPTLCAWSRAYLRNANHLGSGN